MDFSDALMNVKSGFKIARAGWNGKGMWLTLRVPHEPNHLPYIMMKTADNKLVPWLASQTDLLSNDWETIAP